MGWIGRAVDKVMDPGRSFLSATLGGVGAGWPGDHI